MHSTPALRPTVTQTVRRFLEEQGDRRETHQRRSLLGPVIVYMAVPFLD
jgi:hypothetical protein